MGRSNLMSERIGPELAVDEARLTHPRPAVDPDAVLVERLRRRDAGAAEALVASYRDRVYRLAIRITATARMPRRSYRTPSGPPPARSMASAGRPPRNLGLPNHRQRGLSEAAGAASRAERDAVGRPRPLV